MGIFTFKRYFLPIIPIHFGVILDTEPVSGSGSPIHNLWFGPSLGNLGVLSAKGIVPKLRHDESRCICGANKSTTATCPIWRRSARDRQEQSLKTD